jgi:hypothetical protein
MKTVYIGYAFIALVILFATLVKFFKLQFFDVTDAKNLLAGVSVALFIKVINLRRKVNNLEKNENLNDQ